LRAVRVRSRDAAGWPKQRFFGAMNGERRSFHASPMTVLAVRKPFPASDGHHEREANLDLHRPTDR